jgi:hypothetical protein
MARSPVEQLTSHFEFLDELRESGEVNMFGAAPHLARACLLDMPEARTVLSHWMATFSDASPAERAALSPLEASVSVALKGE